MASNYNARSPSVKRIFREIKEMNELMAEQGDGMAQFAAEALESDIFEWLFAVRGPDGTDFESGIYHGRILLPHDYPFKPPSFVMLTPSGRFETQTKICLSISSYHPEHWQPSWSMRTALTALIAFFPAPADSAIGSLETSPEERKRLAAESRLNVPKSNSTERAEVMQKLHNLLLKTKVGAAAAANPVPGCVAAMGAPQFASNGNAPPDPGTSRAPAEAADSERHENAAGSCADAAVMQPAGSSDESRSSDRDAGASAAENRQRQFGQDASEPSTPPQVEARAVEREIAERSGSGDAGAAAVPPCGVAVAGAPSSAAPQVPFDGSTRVAASWAQRLEKWLPQSEGQLHKWRALQDLLRVLQTALLVLLGVHLVYPVF